MDGINYHDSCMLVMALICYIRAAGFYKAQDQNWSGDADMQADEGILARIHQRYGDHLHARGDYDGAMAQYMATMGHLEASYVIRKFLDAQRIHNLTAYLEQLHEKVRCLSSSMTTPMGSIMLLSQAPQNSRVCIFVCCRASELL